MASATPVALAACAVACVGLAACTSGAESENRSTVKASAAAQADISGDTHLWQVGAKDGQFEVPTAAALRDPITLQLNNVNEVAIEFSNRPARRGWVLPMGDLTASWSELFGDDPPNAVLTFARSPEAIPELVVLEIDNPQYDAQGNTFTLDATLIPVVAQPHPTATVPVPASPLIPPDTFQAASLLIDTTLETPVQPTGTFAVIEQESDDADSFTYSAWPTERVAPPGWTSIGFEGTWSEAVSHIEELWTEQRPTSLSGTLEDEADKKEGATS